MDVKAVAEKIRLLMENQDAVALTTPAAAMMSGTVSSLPIAMI